MVTPKELEERYGISIVNTPMDATACSLICVCGYSVLKHHNKGSAGYCEVSTTPPLWMAPHNFLPNWYIKDGIKYNCNKYDCNEETKKELQGD